MYALLLACAAPLRASITIPVGDGPNSVAAGRIDTDDSVDLVSADGGGETLSVRIQQDGGWVPAGDALAVGFAPHHVELLDLDADGDLDLVATGHDEDAVAAWLGDGTGGFVPAPGAPFPSVGAADAHNHGLAAGDLDGDGDGDVVTVDQDARKAAVLLAHAGTLTPAPGSPFDLGAEPYPPALGDLDGDGALDLVVPLISTDRVAVLLGDGAGGFRAATPVSTPRQRPYAVVLGDLDLDGHTDLVVVHDDTNRVEVWGGSGDGAFVPGPRSSESTGGRLWRGAIADYDGDGLPDLIGVGSGAMRVLRGDGNGGLGPARNEGACSGWTTIAPDLDGDGVADPVAPDTDADVLRVWPSRGGG